MFILKTRHKLFEDGLSLPTCIELPLRLAVWTIAEAPTQVPLAAINLAHVYLYPKIAALVAEILTPPPVEVEPELGTDHPAIVFANTAGNLADNALVCLLTEQIKSVPELTVSVVAYRFWMLSRYVRYVAASHRLGAGLWSQREVRPVMAYLSVLSYRVANFTVESRLCKRVFHSRNVALRTYDRLTRALAAKRDSAYTRSALISLAACMQEVESQEVALRDAASHTPEGELVARLHILAQQLDAARKTWPKSLPNPASGVNVGNVRARLAESRKSFFADFAYDLHRRRLTPYSLQGVGLRPFLYWLHGLPLAREGLAQGLEASYQLLSSPMTIALGLIFGLSGYETMELEPEGFGPGSADRLLVVFKDLMNAAGRGASGDELQDIVKASQLIEGSTQAGIESKVRSKLQDTIEEMLYKLLKDGQASQAGVAKSLRENAKSLPILGPVSLVLHGVLSMSVLSIGYAFTAKDRSLPEHIFRNLAGRSLCKHMAERITSLLYHPMWPLALMRIFEAAAYPDTSARFEDEGEALSQISAFLVGHFAKGTVVSEAADEAALDGTALFMSLTRGVAPALISLSMAGLSKVTQAVKGFAASSVRSRAEEGLASFLKEQMTQSQTANSADLLRTIVEGARPLLSEFSLYFRLATFFRARGFSPSLKFCEMVLRAYIQDQLDFGFAETLQAQPEGCKNPRDFLVTQLLALDDAAFAAVFLAKSVSVDQRKINLLRFVEQGEFCVVKRADDPPTPPTPAPVTPQPKARLIVGGVEIIDNFMRAPASAPSSESEQESADSYEMV